MSSCCDPVVWSFVSSPLSPPSGARGGPHSCGLYANMIRQKSLVLFGETRLGKTVWARSLGKHIYFCGLYSGAEAMRYKDVEYAVFDDMQLKFVPQYKNWLGCQKQFQVKILYKDPVIIDWGKPCIWLSNDDPRLEPHLSETDIQWLEGNCVFVNLREPIFRANK